MRLRARSSTSEDFIKYINKTAATGSQEKGSGADEKNPLVDDPFLQKIFVRSERIQYM